MIKLRFRLLDPRAKHAYRAYVRWGRLLFGTSVEQPVMLFADWYVRYWPPEVEVDADDQD